MKLGKKHQEHIAAYGEGNERRLTGDCETADINTFSWGVADRGCSMRVPRDTTEKALPEAECGYLEDRRPSSNVDPYVATALLFETCTRLPVRSCARRNVKSKNPEEMRWNPAPLNDFSRPLWCVRQNRVILSVPKTTNVKVLCWEPTWSDSTANALSRDVTVSCSAINVGGRERTTRGGKRTMWG